MTDYVAPPVPPPGSSLVSPVASAPAGIAVLRGVLRRPTVIASLVVLVGWAVVALAWPALVPSPPGLQRPLERFVPPGSAHPFGTDGFGRDVLSRVLAGARPVLVIAPMATLLAVALGTAIGLVSGYYRGLVDEVTMRTIDAVAVFPTILPVILVVGLMGRSSVLLIVVIAAFFTPLIARTVRTSVLVEREKQYVEAARLRGEAGWWVMAHEILPNISGPIVVEGTVRLGYAVFTSATLSFIGLGAAPGSTEWGAQVADNRINLQFAWWTVLFPSLAIASLVVAVTLVADHLREEVER